jgi:predicted SnoaL-like aldol condensation-catalyzing enzyme
VVYYPLSFDDSRLLGITPVFTHDLFSLFRTKKIAFMKKISFSIILFFLSLVSFSQNEKALANNREVYKAIETGDVSKIKDYIDKDAIDHGGDHDVKGADSIIAMLGSIHNSFTDLKMEVIADAVHGDYVFTLVRLTGTTTATPGMGMPPNKKMDSKSVDVVKLKNGKAVEHWEFVDPKEMMAMMGTQK